MESGALPSLRGTSGTSKNAASASASDAASPPVVRMRPLPPPSSFPSAATTTAKTAPLLLLLLSLLLSSSNVRRTPPPLGVVFVVEAYLPPSPTRSAAASSSAALRPAALFPSLPLRASFSPPSFRFDFRACPSTWSRRRSQTSTTLAVVASSSSIGGDDDGEAGPSRDGAGADGAASGEVLESVGKASYALGRFGLTNVVDAEIVEEEPRVATAVATHPPASLMGRESRRRRRPGKEAGSGGEEDRRRQWVAPSSDARAATVGARWDGAADDDVTIISSRAKSLPLPDLLDELNVMDVRYPPTATRTELERLYVASSILRRRNEAAEARASDVGSRERREPSDWRPHSSRRRPRSSSSIPPRTPEEESRRHRHRRRERRRIRNETRYPPSIWSGVAHMTASIAKRAVRSKTGREVRSAAVGVWKEAKRIGGDVWEEGRRLWEDIETYEEDDEEYDDGGTTTRVREAEWRYVARDDDPPDPGRRGRVGDDFKDDPRPRGPDDDRGARRRRPGSAGRGFADDEPREEAFFGPRAEARGRHHESRGDDNGGDGWTWADRERVAPSGPRQRRQRGPPPRPARPEGNGRVVVPPSPPPRLPLLLPPSAASSEEALDFLPDGRRVVGDTGSSSRSDRPMDRSPRREDERRRRGEARRRDGGVRIDNEKGGRRRSRPKARADASGGTPERGRTAAEPSPSSSSRRRRPAPPPMDRNRRRVATTTDGKEKRIYSVWPQNDDDDIFDRMGNALVDAAYGTMGSVNEKGEEGTGANDDGGRPTKSKRYWRDRLAERVDYALGIHEDGKYYDSWQRQLEREAAKERGNDPISIALGLQPKKRRGFPIEERSGAKKKKRNEVPFWEEEGSLMSLFFGRTPKGKKLTLEKFFAVGGGSGPIVTSVVRSVFRTSLLLSSYAFRWASVRGALPQPVIVLGVFAAATSARPGRRWRAVAIALVSLRTVGELLHGYVYGDDGWEDEDSYEAVVGPSGRRAREDDEFGRSIEGTEGERRSGEEEDLGRRRRFDDPDGRRSPPSTAR